MKRTDYYHELLNQITNADRPWTDKEWNEYRYAKLQIANKNANILFLNACCIATAGIAICFFLWSIASVFMKMKSR